MSLTRVPSSIHLWKVRRVRSEVYLSLVVVSSVHCNDPIKSRACEWALGTSSTSFPSLICLINLVFRFKCFLLIL